MRNLRDGRRSRAFDNAGPRSACAPCAMDVVPWTQHPLEGRTRRRSVNRQIRRGAVVSRARSLIVRDPRRSRLRRSTRSTISSALRARATSSALNFHPRDASATSRPVFRAQGSMTSWMLTDAVSAARVSSFSKVARRSGLQHVHVPRSLSHENQIGRSPHTTQSRGLREFS